MPCENKVKTTQGPQLILPDRSRIQETHREELNISPFLYKRSKTAHILTHLQLGALIYIGKICDDKCKPTLTATHTTVEKN